MIRTRSDQFLANVSRSFSVATKCSLPFTDDCADKLSHAQRFALHLDVDRKDSLSSRYLKLGEACSTIEWSLELLLVNLEREVEFVSFFCFLERMVFASRFRLCNLNELAQ